MQNESKFLRATAVGTVVHRIVSEGYKLNVFSRCERVLPIKVLRIRYGAQSTEFREL